MAENQNLARLKSAYSAWNDSKGARTDAWLDLFTDDFHLVSIGEAQGPLAFGVPRRSKAEVVAYLSSLLADWNMLHWTPETYICEGDRIAMFGRCAWTHKRTGKSVEVRIAHQWTFRNGKAVELIEIFDSARAAAAAVG